LLILDLRDALETVFLMGSRITAFFPERADAAFLTRLLVTIFLTFLPTDDFLLADLAARFCIYSQPEKQALRFGKIGTG